MNRLGILRFGLALGFTIGALNAIFVACVLYFGPDMIQHHLDNTFHGLIGGIIKGKILDQFGALENISTKLGIYGICLHFVMGLVNGILIAGFYNLFGMMMKKRSH